MSHIEFIGPPGAGKSTIYKYMIKNKKRLIGDKKTIASRALSDSSRVFSSAVNLFPKLIAKRISELWYMIWLENTHFDRFVDKNPDYPLVWEYLSSNIKYEKSSLESALNSTAAMYNAGTSVLQNDEVLCLDEGFSQRLVSILWRSEHIETDTISQYYSVMPSPQLIIYIKAPVKTCIERQQKRGNVVISKNWTHEDLDRTQENIHHICERIVHTADSHLEVLTVKNESRIEDVIKEVDENTFIN